MTRDYKDVLVIFGDYQKNWQQHCLNVAKLSQIFASYIAGCDDEFAYIYGLCHDIGRSTPRSHRDPRYHCVDGHRILEGLGYDELKMSPLTHSFPDLSDLTLVPGYYNPLWDNEIIDKENRKIEGIWDTYIPEKLKGYEPNVYDSIICIADLMSAGAKTVSIEKRLEFVNEKYGKTIKYWQTKKAIEQKVMELEDLCGRSLTEILEKSNLR